MKPDLPKYRKPKDVAAVLACPVAFVYELVAQGRLEAIRLGVRAIRISEASLTAFLEAMEVKNK